MAKIDPLDLFNKLDELIRIGKGREASLKLQAFPIRSLPREHRAFFCQLARRLRLNSLALRVLNPVVRPSSRKGTPASENEKAEYAAALTSVGAVDEAIGIFRTLSAAGNPQVLLMEANAHFAVWDYAAAIPVLQRYLAARGLEEYWRLVGLANLAAALVFERQPKADGILRTLLENADPLKYRILHGYALELRAEKAVWAHCWDEARINLRVAAEFFKESDSIESFFIRKWLAIVELFEKGMKVAAPNLRKIKEEAVNRKHWETVRSVDYHSAIAQQDPRLVARLYYGTPFKSLRQHLLRDYVGKDPIPEHSPWVLSKEARVPASACFSLEAVCERHGRLKAGMSLHRLLSVLTTDSYRPLRIAEIHSKLFPGEYFNPVSSPHRIAQLMNRLRGAWKKSRCPLRIAEQGGSYRLESVRPFAILLVGEERPTVDLSNERFRKLHETFGSEEFEVARAARALSLSVRSTIRVLHEAVSEEAIVRIGKGRTRNIGVPNSICGSPLGNDLNLCPFKAA